MQLTVILRTGGTPGILDEAAFTLSFGGSRAIQKRSPLDQESGQAARPSSVEQDTSKDPQSTFSFAFQKGYISLSDHRRKVCLGHAY